MEAHFDAAVALRSKTTDVTGEKLVELDRIFTR